MAQKFEAGRNIRMMNRVEAHAQPEKTERCILLHAEEEKCTSEGKKQEEKGEEGWGTGESNGCVLQGYGLAHSVLNFDGGLALLGVFEESLEIKSVV